MRHSTLCLVVALSVAACAPATRHHHYRVETGPKSFRSVEFPPAPADAVGYRVIRPSEGYPLANCVVSGDPLRAVSPTQRRMDGPMAIVYRDTEIQLCCSACLADFRQAPDTYVARVRDVRR